MHGVAAQARADAPALPVPGRDNEFNLSVPRFPHLTSGVAVRVECRKPCAVGRLQR